MYGYVNCDGFIIFPLYLNLTVRIILISSTTIRGVRADDLDEDASTVFEMVIICKVFRMNW